MRPNQNKKNVNIKQLIQFKQLKNIEKNTIYMLMCRIGLLVCLFASL